ncbi:TIGR03826 family flagellar region protein [Bacillus massilinigeriensis]|uniref:TIGR03826 family flagellar region protein n=1 Tax=Bacillus mediterraneensis TaxID=1805474 RepID=UPI0008F7F0E8|nr:TIGR03826 family flagellar region protein [Bacillus mediterraneensis]
MNLINCPGCGEIFVKNNFRDVCEKCWKAEERAYDTVSKYMRKRENRAATITQVVDATGVKESLILKFVKAGRLRTTQFPNLGYPCDKCGGIIREGRLCASCTSELKEELERYNKEEKRKQQLQRNQTFLSKKSL